MKGLNVNANDTKEMKLLWAIKQSVDSLSAILNGNNSISSNQYALLSAATLTLLANTYKSISFQVVKGSVTLSMDGGDTSITYPIGTSISMSGGKIGEEWDFTLPGVALDGNNITNVQVTN